MPSGQLETIGISAVMKSPIKDLKHMRWPLSNPERRHEGERVTSRLCPNRLIAFFQFTLCTICCNSVNSKSVFTTII